MPRLWTVSSARTAEREIAVTIWPMIGRGCSALCAKCVRANVRRDTMIPPRITSKRFVSDVVIRISHALLAADDAYFVCSI